MVDEIAARQSRPVDPVYPILYVDAIRINIRDGGVVANKAAHVVIDIDGIKQVLGIWIQQTEGAKFWHGVLTELCNRGCRDALFVCCDGLTGFPSAPSGIEITGCSCCLGPGLGGVRAVPGVPGGTGSVKSPKHGVHFLPTPQR